MHPHGVHVFDEADGDLLVLGVAHHLQLQLFPAQNRFFHQHLAHQAGGQAAAHHHPQFVHVVDQPAAGAAHGVGRPHHHRDSPVPWRTLRPAPRCRRSRLLGHLDAQAVHGPLEGHAVLAPLDGVHVHPDHLDPVFFQHPLACASSEDRFRPDWPPRLGSRPSGRSLAMIRVRRLHVQRLDVGVVGHARVGHDGGRIGVDQHYLIAQGS